MNALPTRSKDTIVSVMAAAMQGRVGRFLNFAVGSVFLAIAEAVAGVALWLQAEILGVLKTTRAATSDDVDLDSFIADYGMARLPAVPASGLVTFARFTAGPSPVLIPVGATVQTGDGSQRFAVYKDATLGAWNAGQNGYVMPAGLGSLDVPVVALTAGAAGNVTAGAISLLATSISGVDTVTNAVGFTNGAEAETDAAVRTRIPLYFASLAQATETAIKNAIVSLGLSLQVSFIRSTGRQPFLTVVIDDGSGNPSTDLVAAASAAVGKVRAGGVWVPVIGASTLPATVSMSIEVAPGYVAGDVRAAVAAAITLYVQGLGLGGEVALGRLDQVAFDASPGVAGVSNIVLNGGTADLAPGPGQTIKLTNLVVS